LGDALDAVNLADPLQGEERPEGYDSSGSSAKYGTEITERDPEEEE
jgi:hypothetical protein